MTLHAQTDFSIPEETIRVARAAYPRGTTLMKLRDELGTIYQDQTFASLFPHNGRAVEAPWRLDADYGAAIHGRTARPASRRCRSRSH